MHLIGPTNDNFVTKSFNFNPMRSGLKIKWFCSIALLLTMSCGMAQFRFTGQLNKKQPGTAVYLSLVEDYRKINRVYIDQILIRTLTDTLGNFDFQGNHLYPENRIYRIHTDNCGDVTPADHFLGSCDDIKSILFIANNSDTLDLPTDLSGEVFCDINSSNPKAGLFLVLDELKEEMILDFTQYNSDANTQLLLRKWFDNLQEYGLKQDEPLIELAIYELLSDKRNPTYNYYLAELTSNPYYDGLAERLEAKYPNASFTRLYTAEIETDRELANLGKPATSRANYLVYIILALSLLLNLLLYTRWRRSKYRKFEALKKLTPQEQKIVDNILRDMSNKQIADELFVSVSTVKTHINNLYKKLEVSNREAVKELFGK